jgi:UDP-glucose 4-epimerase
LTQGGKSEVFNLGNGRGWSVKEIVSKVEDIFDVVLKAEKGEVRKGEYAKVYADNDKVKKVLDWEPEKSLEESVLSLKRWYESHPVGWEK